MGLRTFTFDGVQSSDFGVFFTEASPYNAPERAVEMIDIPGRNGAYALDLGKFENIEVTYHAVVAANNNTNFTEAISNFRNFLCSRVGYCRLTDDYNPGEYRMATYRSGLETDGVYNNGAEFDIVFDCKPQRYLAIGEEVVTIGAWGDTTTLEGDVVQFDALATDKVKSLTAQIDPIQDLHGYDAPWVGGAGKNKLALNLSPAAAQTTSAVSSIATQTENVLEFTTTQNGSYGMVRLNYTLPAGRYTLSIKTTSSDSGYTPKCVVYIGSSVLQNVTQGDPHWFELAEETTVNFRFFGSEATATQRTVKFYDVQLESGTTPTTWTPYSNICPISGHDDVTVTVADDVDNPTVSEDYTTTLPSTTYGGTLDVVSGLLTDGCGNITEEDFTSLYGPTSGGLYYANCYKSDLIENATGFCSHFEQKTTNAAWTSTTPCFAIESTRIRVYMNKSTLASFKTAYSDLQIVYPTSTPTTTQLTGQQVELLLGENNIFADSGNVTVEYGQDPAVLINPTNFDSSPLLQVWGYGDVNLGSRTLNISNVPLGDITLLEPFNYNNNGSYIFTNPLVLTYDFDSSLVNNGDTIYIEPCITNSSWKCDFSSYMPGAKSTFTYSDTNVDFHDVMMGYSTLQNAHIMPSVTISATSFIKGTSSTTSASSAITLPLVNTSDGTATGQSLQLTVSVATSYDGDDTFTTTITCTIVADPLSIMDSSRIGNTYRRKTISADSSVQTVQPTYIDLDIGEAYAIDNGSVISLNNAVSMPSDLPTLPSGNTTVTYDNTVTDLKVTPRWWKV